MLVNETKSPVPEPGKLAQAARDRLLEWGVENFALWLAEERDEYETAEAHLFAAAAATAEDLLAATLLLVALKAPPSLRSKRVVEVSQLILKNAFARAALMEEACAETPSA